MKGKRVNRRSLLMGLALAPARPRRDGFGIAAGACGLTAWRLRIKSLYGGTSAEGMAPGLAAEPRELSCSSFTHRDN